MLGLRFCRLANLAKATVSSAMRPVLRITTFCWLVRNALANMPSLLLRLVMLYVMFLLSRRLRKPKVNTPLREVVSLQSINTGWAWGNRRR